MRSYFLFAALLAAAAIVCSQPAPRERVGPLPGGGFLLNSGWRLAPAGRQTPLDTFPMSTALSPDGRYLLVLNGGYKPPSISVLETATGHETNRVPVADGWLGLTFSPKGNRVYVSGGSRATVFEFSFSNGTLEATRAFVVVPAGKAHARGFYRRCGAHAGWPPGLRRGPVSRFACGDQSAVRDGDRSCQDRPEALPDSLSSRRQILVRHKLDRRLGWSL